MTSIKLAAACALTILAASGAAAQEPGRAIIVLDASGSMWGQIDGINKIVIARDSLSELVDGLDPALSLGLMAYGHRERGNCGDIELLVEPAAGAGPRIAEIARGLNPKGMTPLTEAVRQAAQALRYSEMRASVVLITDGIETCDADPCALAAELEATGVDFTAHVVGFDLSDEEGRAVACLAEETGGLFLTADDAPSLGSAMATAVAEVTAPTPTPAPLPTAVPTALPTPTPVPAPTATPVPTPLPTPLPTATPFPTPTPVPLPRASLDVPAMVEIAAPLTIGWDGPGEEFDTVQIWDPRARGGAGEVFRSRRVVQDDMEGRTVTLPAPAVPGVYEVRYVFAPADAVIATVTVEVVEQLVALEAPDAVAAASGIEVRWTGPGADFDDVQIFDPASGRVLRSRRVNPARDAERPIVLAAPAEPGIYELRYFNGESDVVLATRPIEVTPAVVTLDAPDAVTAAGAVDIAWSGPGADYDDVQIVDLASGRVVHGRRISGAASGTATLPVPAAPGTYEIRYFNGDNDAVLATRPIEVTPGVVTLDGPQTVEAAVQIDVAWSGPGATYDDIQIFDPAAGRVQRSKRISGAQSGVAELPAPAEPGDYEIRYFNGDNDAVLATRRIAVTPSTATLEAQASVAAGAEFEVIWTGPGGAYDNVEIFDTAANRAIVSKRLPRGARSGTQVLTAPEAPGTYELRLYNGDNRVVLTRRALAVGG